MSLHERARTLTVSDADFGLSTAERAELRSHLVACAECRRFGEGVRDDALLLERLAAGASRAGASARVRQKVLAAASGTARPYPHLVLQFAMLALVTLLLVAIAALMVAGARPLLRAEEPTPTPRAASAGVLAATIDTSGRLPPEPEYCTIGLGDHRSPDCRIGLVAGDGSMWVDAGIGILRVDPATNAVVAAIALPSDPRDLVFVDGTLYAATEAGTIARIDPARNAMASTIPVAARPLAAMTAAEDGRLWVTIPKDGSVALVDPESASVVALVDVGGEPFDVATAAGSVWVSDRASSRVTRVDGTTGEIVATIQMRAFGSRELETTEAGLWVAGDGQVALIDPVAGVVASEVAAPALANLGSGPTGLWLMAVVNAQLRLLDGRAATEVGRLDLPEVAGVEEQEAVVTEALGSVWVAYYGSPSLLRVDPP